jgi:hypothetical protein
MAVEPGEHMTTLPVITREKIGEALAANKPHHEELFAAIALLMGNDHTRGRLTKG